MALPDPARCAAYRFSDLIDQPGLITLVRGPATNKLEFVYKLSTLKAGAIDVG